MTDIVLTPITSGYNLSKINSNFDTIEEVINEEVLHLEGGNNTMQQDLDMNGHDLLNININPDDPGSLLTRAAADALYYNIEGDTLEGPLNADFQEIYNLRESVNPTDAVRKQELTDETNARIAGDQSLQEQINGTNPPMGSEFSVISWHAQHITNSIAIPEDVNAWSFGPVITIDPGQVVTIGSGSYYTVANGEVQP